MYLMGKYCCLLLQGSVSTQTLEGAQAELTEVYIAAQGRKDPKVLATRRAAKRARAALLKYVRSIAEFAVIAA